MKNKKIIIMFIVIIVMIFTSFGLYINTGIKGFEKEISNFTLPNGVEKISMKSGIGDSGGNGDYLINISSCFGCKNTNVNR